MQSEHFDNKIREAADHHHPAYDEKAWGKMEALLDKHLPEEKDDRRRIFFFLLLFLLVGGVIWLGINNRRGHNDNIITAVKQQEAQSSTVQEAVKDGSSSTTTNNQPNAINNEVTTNTTTYADNTKEIPVASVKEEKTNPLSTTTSKNQKEINTAPLLSNNGYKEKNATAFFDVTNGKSKKNQVVTKNTDNENVITTTNDKLITGNTVTTNPVTDKQTVAPVTGKTETPVAATKETATNEKKEVAVVTTTKETQQPEQVSKTPDIKKAKNKKTNSFFFTVSAGPDISFSGSDKLGKTKLLAGAGLGYTFKDRLTIRTGFYTGRKVYSASPGEYHPPTSFWSYYPYLQKVDADCKVYEIPLTVSYNFGKSSKAKWFASTGLSSYLMKKETYNYSYKQTATGPTYTQKWSITDQNKHYFSVLTLSAGYKRDLNKTISIMAEPYLKLPLTGVGYGKVKLNSGGMLFTIGIKPFGAAKKSH